MKTFGTIDAKDYNVEELYTSAPMSWELVSGSTGVVITSPEDLIGAVNIYRATNSEEEYYAEEIPQTNIETGVPEYLLYRSVKHLFYNNRYFNTVSGLGTSSIAGYPDASYVVSIGQNFYGDRIKPGSFELSTDISNVSIRDDDVGNLYVSQSGVGYYVGNVFYDSGIAVIKHDTGSINTAISSTGLKIVSGSVIYVDYSSDVKFHRHEINVNVLPSDFNFSLFNPSIFSTFQTSGSTSQSFSDMNIRTSGSSADTWNVYNLMGAGIIKPYITTIGLYNDQYELLAVAKMSEPIQRSFDINQIFIVRFDT